MGSDPSHGHGPVERLASDSIRAVLPGVDDPDVARVRAIVHGRMLGEPILPPRIGRFLLIERIGQGGMGVVFAGFDAELERKVAIKLLRRGLDDVVFRDRIAREARAMAKLSHPNVAQVYEVGEHEGRTFIAMEFVRGPTLRAWVAASPRSWHEIVAMYAQAGEGLAAAHAVGLAHRDFKPDNAIVGVDARGAERVRVVDFGLAQGGRSSEEPTTTPDPSPPRASTHDGAIAGTPAYMPPEQRRGEPADARSDEYSFCASLREALHGANATVPRWIDRALQRGLAERPTDRFATMGELLAALGEDPSRRRKRWMFAALGVTVIVAALAGTGLARARRIAGCERAASAIDEAWNDDARARVRDAILGSERAFATDTWRRVEPLLDDYAGRWSQLREETCRLADVEGARSADLSIRSDACFDERRASLASLVDVLATSDPPPVHRAIASALRLPRPQSCADDGWLVAHPAPPRDASLRAEVAALTAEFGRNEIALDATRSIDGLGRARTIAAQAEASGFAPLFARALLGLGTYEHEAGHYESAKDAVKRAVTIAMQSGSTEIAADASASMITTSLALGAKDEALWWGWLAESLLAQERVADPMREVSLLGKLAGVHQQRHDYAKADEVLVRALAIAEEAFGPEHPQVAWVSARLAIIRGEQGMHVEALALFERTLAIQEHALGSTHPDLAQTLGGIGSTHFMHERYDRAIPAFERALAIREAAVGPEHPSISELLNVLASCYSPTGQHERGLAARARALAIAERTYGPDSEAVAQILLNRGAVASDRREYDDAFADFQRALAIFETLPGAELDVGLALTNLAELHDLRGAPHEAIELFPRAIALQVAGLGEDHIRVAAAVLAEGLAAEHVGDYATAARDAERALAICAKADCRSDQRERATAALARAVRLGAGEPR